MAASPRCTQARPHGTDLHGHRALVQARCSGGHGLSLPPDTTVLTSVCALGSPALALSRTSSKGVSMSPSTGPLTGKQCHGAGLLLGRGREDSKNGQTWSTSP